ncbi:MAG: acriflavine resistance protein B [Phyllobacteriaceae bacterium]|nr:acriflavine resistance protein B [Phyllobacteriaceae bacterium]
MSISAPFIRRPVATILVMVAVLAAGFFGYRQLPVAAVPRVDFPTISVTAKLPGASPETMASSVAAVLERQFSGIAGLAAMSSVSVNGSTNVTLQFDLARDIDGAALDVQAAIGTAQRQLPPEMTDPPSFRKVNPADQPILFLALKSDVLKLSDVDDFAETDIAQRLSTLPGVAQVNVYGAQKYAVRIEANLDALASRGLTVDDLKTAVAAANTNSPVGGLDGPDRTVTLAATGPIERAAGYMPLIVSWQNGAPVRLRDVAQARDSVENDKVAAWLDGTRAIMLAIQRQPDANTVEVVDRIRTLLPTITADMPPAIDLQVMQDRSQSIRAAIDDVELTLAIAMALVIGVIYLFLKSARATVIPTLALPVSLIGTFGGMYLFGFSLDNISLLALTLAVGFVVDDAIVMLENIVRHVEMGEPPMRAAFLGAAEVGFTIVSMTISLVAVFIPVLFMGGVVGRMFFEFGVTITLAILLSGLVSLTLTPMLAARIVDERQVHGRPNIVVRGFDAVFAAVTRFYSASLDVVLKAKWAMLIVLAITVGWTVHLYVSIPKGFFPQEDTGLVSGSTQGPDDVSFPAMSELQKQVAAIVAADPDVLSVMSTVGAGSAAANQSSGRMFVQLKAKPERKSSSNEVIARLRKATAQVPGINSYFQNVQNINIGTTFSRAQWQYTVQAVDFRELREIAPKLEQAIRRIPGVLDVSSDLQVRGRQAIVDIDRDRAARLGLTVDQLRSRLYSAYGSRVVSTIYTDTASYSVILEANPDFTASPDLLRRLTLRTPSGTTVPLDAVATIREAPAPTLVNHKGQLPAVTISFNLQPGTALSEAVTAIGQIEREVGLSPTVQTGFSGTAQVFQDAVAGQGMLLFAAVLVIYIVLGILYESFVHPLTILSGLPAAGIGALLTLRLFGLDLSVIAMIGIVMLIGIVKKNAIMIVDFAVERRANGLTAIEAVHEACLLRFRPIMMTSLAAILGTLPIALGVGAGAELRQPLGLAVVGGLVVSQLLTLYMTPVVYLLLDPLTRSKRPHLDDEAKATA